MTIAGLTLAIVYVHAADGGDIAYRCGACESLNIDEEAQRTGNDEPVTCPDCGTINLIPFIQFCTCAECIKFAKGV